MRAAIRAFDYDASTSRDLDFTGRCVSSLGKTEAGCRPPSWHRCDGQRPSVGHHYLLNNRQAEPGPLFCSVAGLEWFDELASGTWRDSSTIVADRYAAATEVSHDTSGAVRVDQRVADQVGQGAADRRLDAVHHDGALFGRLQREFDSGAQRGGAEIRKDVPRQGRKIDGPLFDRMIL